MKPLKKATQKNFEIDKHMYTSAEFEKIMEMDGVSEVDAVLLISTSVVKNVTVTCQDGFYYNVAITNDGQRIFVTL